MGRETATKTAKEHPPSIYIGVPIELEIKKKT